MKTYTCIIIDDEELALDVLEDYVVKVDTLHLVGRFSNAVEAYNFIIQQPVELIFVDINMPELSGLELISALKNPPAVVITTAYREYAVEGFELNVLDYLVKPIAFSRFLQSVHRFLKAKNQTPVSEPDEQYLLIRADRRTIQLNYDEITLVEGLKDYVKVHTTSSTHLTKDSIGLFYKKLPAHLFCRVHRSYIVNKHHIHSYSHEDLQIGKQRIAIGTTYKQSFFNFMEKGTDV